eukprot:Sspe_Gene.8350::Locus_2846_Transcript_1_1_Confidence_1.000_Length_5194::g.8350::m.8350
MTHSLGVRFLVTLAKGSCFALELDFTARWNGRKVFPLSVIGKVLFIVTSREHGKVVRVRDVAVARVVRGGDELEDLLGTALHPQPGEHTPHLWRHEVPRPAGVDGREGLPQGESLLLQLAVDARPHSTLLQQHKGVQQPAYFAQRRGLPLRHRPTATASHHLAEEDQTLGWRRAVQRTKEKVGLCVPVLHLPVEVLEAGLCLRCLVPVPLEWIGLRCVQEHSVRGNTPQPQLCTGVGLEERLPLPLPHVHATPDGLRLAERKGNEVPPGLLAPQYITLDSLHHLVAGQLPVLRLVHNLLLHCVERDLVAQGNLEEVDDVRARVPVGVLPLDQRKCPDEVVRLVDLPVVAAWSVLELHIRLVGDPLQHTDHVLYTPLAAPPQVEEVAAGHQSRREAHVAAAVELEVCHGVQMACCLEAVQRLELPRHRLFPIPRVDEVDVLLDLDFLLLLLLLLL